MLSGWIQKVLAPPARLFRAAADKTNSVFSHYVFLTGAQAENQALKAQVTDLKQEIARWEMLEREGVLKEEQAEKARFLPLPTKAARVIGYDVLRLRRSVKIDLGEKDGVQRDQAVLADGALIGRVLQVGPSSSQVLLITDPDHAVDVLDENSRARGILVGLRKSMSLHRDQYLTQMEWANAGSEIQVGDALVTSGMDGMFPKGLKVGQVKAVRHDTSGLFLEAEVAPQAELNKLENVLVVLKHGNSST